MQVDLLLKHIQSYVDFPNRDFENFLKLLVPVKLKKNEHFYRAGDVPRYSPFILKGCLRQYIINDEGEEQTIHFNEEGNWAGQIGSMRSRVPTNVNLQALEDCDILAITIENADLGMKQFPAYLQYFLKKYPADHAMMVENAHKLKTESPELLYADLLKTRPTLLLRVPQHYIANYLGVRTETISRIKNKLARR